MTKNKKVRIEIRFDEVDDKEMIDFIDNNGSTRAGFIKQVLNLYKNQIESTSASTLNKVIEVKSEDVRKNDSKPKKRKLNDISFSSKILK